MLAPGLKVSNICTCLRVMPVKGIPVLEINFLVRTLLRFDEPCGGGVDEISLRGDRLELASLERADIGGRRSANRFASFECCRHVKDSVDIPFEGIRELLKLIQTQITESSLFLQAVGGQFSHDFVSVAERHLFQDQVVGKVSREEERIVRGCLSPVFANFRCFHHLGEDITETCDRVPATPLRCPHPKSTRQKIYQIWTKGETIKLQINGMDLELEDDDVVTLLAAVQVISDTITACYVFKNYFINDPEDILDSVQFDPDEETTAELYCVNWLPVKGSHHELTVSLRCPEEPMMDEYGNTQPILECGQSVACDWTGTCGYQVQQKGSGGPGGGCLAINFDTVERVCPDPYYDSADTPALIAEVSKFCCGLDLSEIEGALRDDGRVDIYDCAYSTPMLSGTDKETPIVGGFAMWMEDPDNPGECRWILQNFLALTECAPAPAT